MASQGPFLPNAAADVGVSTSWSNPNNAKTDDGTFAVMSLAADPAQANYLALTDFGFSIPAAATIDGILVEANDVGTTEIPQPYVTATKNGTGWSGSLSMLAGGSGWVASSTNTELFANTWTDSEINASTFGILVLVTADSFMPSVVQLDALRVTVYYTDSVPQQIAYPDADTDASTWTATPLWSKVDEPTTPSDADYITATAT